MGVLNELFVLDASCLVQNILQDAGANSAHVLNNSLK